MILLLNLCPGCGESASELECSGEFAVRPGASVKSAPASGAFGKLAVRSVTLNLQQDQVGVSPQVYIA